MKEKNSSCRNIRELLYKESVSVISLRETQSVKIHISECQDCAAYAHNMPLIFDSLKNDAVDLSPNPNILTFLKNRLKDSHNQFSRSKKRSVRTFFGSRYYRISAAAAVLVLMLIYLGVRTSNNILIDTDGYTAIDTLSIIRPSVISLENLETQKIGKSVAEDTLLMNFMTRAM